MKEYMEFIVILTTLFGIAMYQYGYSRGRQKGYTEAKSVYDEAHKNVVEMIKAETENFIKRTKNDSVN